MWLTDDPRTGGRTMTVAGAQAVDDDEIRVLVSRLSRPHRSGGRVIERAAILAEGTRSTAVLEWLGDHDWTAEAEAPRAAARGGLHGLRDGGRREQMPRRYVSPFGGTARPSPAIEF
jgi:hypothetical protein